MSGARKVVVLPDKKTIISPGQGLLLLISHYKTDQLKKLYLCGAGNKNDARKIRKLLQDPILSKYQISYDEQTINNDSTRRYFETHLAYETLKNGLSKIDKDNLNYHFGSLKNLLPLNIRTQVGYVLRGEFKDNDDNFFKEYANYIQKINLGIIFDQLSIEDREKIELLVKCSFLGVVNSKYVRLPLDIYGTGIYSSTNKGKILLQGQETTRNQNLGLMKGYMPLMANDIALSKKEFPYLKPSDQASFIKHSTWAKLNFKKMVHPFSNSISGTLLCQLRAHAELRNKGKNVFTDSAKKLAQYNQLLISAMLFNSGGHSLNEFVAPLSLNAVKKEFGLIKDFEKTITLESMYFTNNKEGLNKALQDTIVYNEAVLLRGNLHTQIRNIHSIEPKNDVLFKLKIKKEFDRLKKQYAYRINNQWLTSYRVGREKNTLIQAGLNEALKYIDTKNFSKAQNVIKNLKKELKASFGKNNFWGQKLEALKLVELAENELKVYLLKKRN